MRKTFTSYIKKIVALTAKDELKNFKENQEWQEVKDLSFLINLPPKETLVFSIAYYLTITEDTFNTKEIRNVLSGDPFIIGEFIQIINSLKRKGLVYSRRRSINEEFKITDQVIIDISNNKSPVTLQSKEEKDFFGISEELIEIFMMKMDNLMSLDEFNSELQDVIAIQKDYKPFTFLIKKRIPKEEWNFFLYVFLAHIHGENDASLKKGVNNFYHGAKKQFEISSKLSSQKASIIKKSIIELSEGTFKGGGRVKVTDKAMKDILAKDYDLVMSNLAKEIQQDDLIDPKKITKLNLFYNERERKQLSTIEKLLEPNRLKNIQSGLSKTGYKTGICILLHGLPGTGKTESVLQLARKSGRPIMKVEIGTIRDKFVGESEKNLLEVFKKYERIRETSKLTPILLFNEADALFNKRVEVQQNADQMNNAMQNILLEELENFQGILFATTNLADNLDSAFERRFLYKVEFKNPEGNVRKAIWLQHFPELKEEDIDFMVEEFELSGGQIENIVRKIKLDNIIHDSILEIDTLIQLCKDEFLNSSNASRREIGFTNN